MIDWKKHTQEVLKSLNHRTKKSMGQNFLINKYIVNQIVDSADIKPSDHILEIGGGIGILTDSLVRSGAEVTVIEKDENLAKHLMKSFPNINLIIGDALSVPFPKNCRIISNLPYSISTPLLDRILHHDIIDATVMLQKEVAQRCIANAGDDQYSRLSILCRLHSTSKIILKLNSDSFVPQPKVDSAVVKFEKISVNTINSHDELEALCRNLFSLKRRTLRSVIRGYLKRKVNDPKVWDNLPFNEKRVSHLSIDELDQILIYLKENDVWPIAGGNND